MSSQIKDILTKLDEGKKLTLSFPSPKERELFRVALYKAKRDVDEIFLMINPEYVIGVLNFTKVLDINHTGSEYHPKFHAELYITKKQDTPKRGYSFSIVGEEEQQQDEHSNPGPIPNPS